MVRYDRFNFGCFGSVIRDMLRPAKAGILIVSMASLSNALMKVSQRALHGTNIQLQLKSSGANSKLAPAIEDNLLRICEEAVTNALKTRSFRASGSESGIRFRRTAASNSR